MTLKADTIYNGKVTGSGFVESSRGTPGLQLFIETEDGEIDHTIWLTPATKERAIKDFGVLGADVTKLNSSSYLNNGLCESIRGAEISFKTKLETYQEKTSIRVAWIGKPRATAGGKTIPQAAAEFFGAPVLDDDDSMPF